MKKYRNYIIAILIIITALITICFIPISATKLIPTIEKQISESIGTDAHLEHLVLRLGPSLKAKTPIIHIMYEDGQKFAQLDSVKFYIPWSSVIKKKPVIKSLTVKRIVVRVNSDDKYLPKLLTKLSEKNYAEIPNINIKEYKISYFNKEYNDNYVITGNELILNKLLKYKNFKLSTKGYLEINNTQYINYDVSLLPQFDMQKSILPTEINKFFNKIKIIDFHSDVIADLKLYKNSDDKLQASGFVNVDNISVLDKTEKAS
ncbi:MAG: hypothetical protein MJ230_07655, partial [bacterium]|nr:hypothetical protein [bacterium]